MKHEIIVIMTLLTIPACSEEKGTNKLVYSIDLADWNLSKQFGLKGNDLDEDVFCISSDVKLLFPNETAPGKTYFEIEVLDESGTRLSHSTKRIQNELLIHETEGMYFRMEASDTLLQSKLKTAHFVKITLHKPNDVAVDRARIKVFATKQNTQPFR